MTGARYSADIPMEHLAYGAIFTSALAKGRVVEIDTQAAAQVKITYAEEPAIATLQTAISSGQAPETLSEAMAAQFNTTRGIDRELAVANDRVDATQVDRSNESASADVRIDAIYSTQTIYHHPLELSATTAVWEGDRLTLYDATQWIYGDRNAVATMLGLPQDKVRIVSHFVGGGFGCKCFTWSHVILAAIAAKHIGRPVKVGLTRSQMFTSVGYRAPSALCLSVSNRDGQRAFISRPRSNSRRNLSRYSHSASVGIRRSI